MQNLKNILWNSTQNILIHWKLCISHWYEHLGALGSYFHMIKWKHFLRYWPFVRGNHPGEFPAQRPVTRIFDVFLDLRPNKRSSKESWGWWFETLSCSLWRHYNDPVPSDWINQLRKARIGFVISIANVEMGMFHYTWRLPSWVFASFWIRGRRVHGDRFAVTFR